MGVSIHCVQAKSIVPISSFEEYEDILYSGQYEYPLVSFENEKNFLGIGEPVFEDGYKAYWGFIDVAKRPIVWRAGSYSYWTLFVNFITLILKEIPNLTSLFTDWLKVLSAGETVLGPKIVKAFTTILVKAKPRIMAATLDLKAFRTSYLELLSIFKTANKFGAFLFFN